MRVENWESKLEKVIQETINKNYWRIGRNDCITFPINCIEAITNIKVFEKKYKSLKDGKKLLKELRSKDILDLATRTAKEHNFKNVSNILNLYKKGKSNSIILNFDENSSFWVLVVPKLFFIRLPVFK